MGESDIETPDKLESAVSSHGDHPEGAEPVHGAPAPDPSAAVPEVKRLPKLKRKRKPLYQRLKDPDPLDDKDLNKLRMMHEGRPCPLCDRTTQAKEVEKAYKRWWPVQEIAEFFGFKRHVIKAHADAMGWTKDRAESTPEIYVRLMDELMENFDASKLPQKTIAEMVFKIPRWIDRLQGKVVNRQEINEHKSVVFMSIPLPGGDAPIQLGAPSAPALPPAKTLDASWEES